jgi:hypothetical protein
MLRDTMNTLPQKIYDLIDFGWKTKNLGEYARWASRVQAFLQRVSPNEAAEFYEISNKADLGNWDYARASQIGFLEGLSAKVEDVEGALAALAGSSATPVVPASAHSKKVFVVHGHDNEAKETVARFLERLALEPIILHEQANEGRTVIEKFEVHANVGFAVVLLTQMMLAPWQVNEQT